MRSVVLLALPGNTRRVERSRVDFELRSEYFASCCRRQGRNDKMFQLRSVVLLVALMALDARAIVSPFEDLHDILSPPGKPWRSIVFRIPKL